ncbi:FtsX-like permease family protein [Microbacterium sp. NPDC057659]|uniref:FtsX-like permease family protein n=1 Tax=Microbacterium sp. NPDC057659 TaxID=3346198 RepID=UPI00366E9377
MIRRARPGVILRLAWRQLLRTAGSSVLVASLVAVPVAGAVAGLTFLESRTPTAQQAATLELGQAQSWIQIIGGPDPSRTQAVDMPFMTSVAQDENGVAKNSEQPVPNGLEHAGLPAGTESIPLGLSEGVRLRTPDGIATFTQISGASWDPRLEGKFEVLSGRTPASVDEAMASPTLLERLGLKVGDDAVLPDEDRRVRIVGTMQAMDANTYSRQTFFAPLPDDVEPTSLVWFLPAWQPDMAELSALNRAGYISFARDLVIDPPPGAVLGGEFVPESEKWATAATVSLSAAFAAVLVGLLSAAAMAVSARRQQRSLAVVTTIGARRADVFRIVLTQGALLGLAGGVIGAVIGIGGVAAALAVMNPGVQGTFWSSWGLTVPWTVPVAVLLAVLVGLIASLAPARTATHGDVLSALRGARRPAPASRRQPRWGVVVLLLGLATVTVTGIALGTAAAQGIWGVPTLVMLWILIVGVLLLLLGVVLSGQAILAAIAWLLPRFGSAPRLASRDAVANSSRTVPAFVAIAASTAVAAFVLCAMAMISAQTQRTYAWQGPEGSIAVTGWGDSVGADPAFLRQSGAERIVSVSSPPEMSVDENGDPIFADSDAVSVDNYYDGTTAGTEAGWASMYGTAVAVIAPDDLEALTGLTMSARELSDFADGGVIASAPGVVGPDSMVRLSFWDQKEVHTSGSPTPLRTVELPADVRTGRGSAWPVVLSPAAAQALGIIAVPTTWVALFDGGASVPTQDRVRADAETAESAGGNYTVSVETGPESIAPWLVLVFAAVSAIVIAAAAISLGLARIERRDDDATLAAVGATTRVRRAIGAWQALIIVGVGCAVGIAIGLIGAWALTQAAAPTLMLADLPFLWLTALGIGLPLMIALFSLGIRPPQATLTRRSAIA